MGIATPASRARNDGNDCGIIELLANLGTSIFISATDTDVGKTYISIALLRELMARGFKPAYYKPIQCGEPSDMDCVKSELPELAIYNTYYLAYPAAPSFAAGMGILRYAQDDGVYVHEDSIDIAQIIMDFKTIQAKHSIVIVEGAGGLAVPITNNYLVSDLIRDLALPLLLVTRPNLGTINHTLLSLEHARNKSINLLGFYTNFPDRLDAAQLGMGPAVYLPHELAAPSIITKASGARALGNISEIIEQCIIIPASLK